MWHSDQMANFGSDTVWLFEVDVPAGTATSTTLGRFVIAEYQGPSTPRQLTISSQACDFRHVDSTGATGPLAVSNGSTASISFGVSTMTSAGGTAYLQAGRTYYVSARNWELDPTPGTSCAQTTCNAIMNETAAAP